MDQLGAVAAGLGGAGKHCYPPSPKPTEVTSGHGGAEEILICVFLYE